MRFLSAVVLSVGLVVKPAAAATLSAHEVLGLGDATATLIKVSIPVTINQAVAIGINSQNTTALADSRVTSTNKEFSVPLTLGSFRGKNQSAVIHELGHYLSGLDIRLPAGTDDLIPDSANFGTPGRAGGAVPRADVAVPVPLPAGLPLALGGFGALGFFRLLRRWRGPALPGEFQREVQHR